MRYIYIHVEPVIMYHIGSYVSVYIGRYAYPMYILHMSF